MTNKTDNSSRYPEPGNIITFFYLRFSFLSIQTLHTFIPKLSIFMTIQYIAQASDKTYLTPIKKKTLCKGGEWL